MGLKSTLLKPYARYVSNKIHRDSKRAVEIQEKTLLKNIRYAEKTAFGKDHLFHQIKNYSDYKNQVPIREYPALKKYIDRFLNGEKDVSWPGLPKYIIGTAGTTGGIKHIPLSKESIPFHLKAGTHAGLSYAYRNNLMDMFDGKLIFLSGSPALGKIGSIPTGRLSGIVNHEIPSWLRNSQLPSIETNCIPDWIEKIHHIVLETHKQDLRMISGIPPWIVMYLEKLLEYTGKKNVIDVFPNLRLLIHGGVSYKPYQSIINNLIGAPIAFLETYPSTEGFIAFQDGHPDEGMLLNSNGGVFFEFVPADEIFNKNPTRLHLRDIKLDTNYAVIINNNAGLWGSIIGDTIKFSSKNPYRLFFTGRIAQYLSAFGEHIISSNVEDAIRRTVDQTKIEVKEFTVAPYIDQEICQHHWLIEYQNGHGNMAQFEKILDQEMQKENFHYRDLVAGKIIQPLKITAIKKDGFRQYLYSQGKLGGQNKVPRLSNDYHIVNQLMQFAE